MINALFIPEAVLLLPHHPRKYAFARGGLVFKAHRLVHHSTLGSRVIKKKRTHVYSHRYMYYGEVGSRLKVLKRS